MLGRNVNAFEALREQLACLEAYVGDEPQDADVTFFGRMTEIYTKPSVQRGRPRINTSETLKRELKDQFLPKTMDWMALESLKRLKHTETIRDYAKEFTSLILNMKDMSKVDKLFKFISRLQGWTQTKLRRCLIDYQLDASSSTSQKGKGLQQQ
ncbi:hypothetical protein CK203_060919 [Vitis vinifera]|uniref:Retrotransposon gag domain-containing protein n=1 Tax=Vitis vinifera TaxID=29760 RepID=A0A438GGN8_VITVI|nr:hypothetical protein CK203_060919 [Vitis vinifera]